MKSVLVAAFAIAVPTFSTAAPVSVDLSSWQENGNPSNAAGNWIVQPGNDSVYQSINGRPTVFFEAGSNAQNTALAGTIEVASYESDDDFIGFVLGYQDGEINSTTADFWLVDWKRSAQSGQTAGLSLSHVFGDLSTTGTGVTGEWWQHIEPVLEVQRAANLGTTGYTRGVQNTFDLIFTENLIEVKVDGATEISFSSAENGALFTDGAFGFYNFSQARVTYAGITEQNLPDPSAVPLPASLPLLVVGLGGFAALRRRKARAAA